MVVGSFGERPNISIALCSEFQLFCVKKKTNYLLINDDKVVMFILYFC